MQRAALLASTVVIGAAIGVPAALGLIFFAQVVLFLLLVAFAAVLGSAILDNVRDAKRRKETAEHRSHAT